MRIGIIGLGIMGLAYARNLLAAGFEVTGHDILKSRCELLEKSGGKAVDALGNWIEDCEVLIFALVSPKAMMEVIEKLGSFKLNGRIILEMGTFALEDKMSAKDAIENFGADIIDCPVSGTGAQAVNADLVLLPSGLDSAIDRVKPILKSIGHTIIEAGEFGMGSKLKFVANHAVALHNVAAAESLNLADSFGLDRQTVYQMLSNGAGQSRMSDLRMPLMIDKNYEPATATLSMFEKDLTIIGNEIKNHAAKTPVFDAVRILYDWTFSNVSRSYDSAAVFEAYQNED